jgi:hemerythrin
MAIEWQEELATGVEHIDAQHKGIFAMFAEFTAACNDGCANVELLNLMGFLEEYTRDHFRDEEKVMLEAEYPDLSIQRENHKSFLSEIAKLKRKVCENGPYMPEILEIKRLLIRWLIQHIRYLDMAFVDFLKGTAGSPQAVGN